MTLIIQKGKSHIMDTNIFQRYEKKYLLNTNQYTNFLNAISNKLTYAEYPKATIQNLYFDTPTDLLIRRSIEKPVYKEKFRLRSYNPGSVGNDDMIFAELKRKYHGVVYKRRTRIPLCSAYDLLSGKTAPKTQIEKEIREFFSFYPELSPAMYISYNRDAFVSKSDPDLRITFDTNLRYSYDRLTFGQTADLLPIANGKSVLVEIKTATAFPLWLTNALSREKIYPTSFSKYANAYFEKTQKISKEGAHCA